MLLSLDEGCLPQSANYCEKDKAFLRVAPLFVEKNLFWGLWRYENRRIE